MAAFSPLSALIRLLFLKLQISTPAASARQARSAMSNMIVSVST